VKEEKDLSAGISGGSNPFIMKLSVVLVGHRHLNDSRAKHIRRHSKRESVFSVQKGGE